MKRQEEMGRGIVELAALVGKLQKIRGAIKSSVLIDHECEECGNFTSIRYEIRELKEVIELLDGKGRDV